MWDCGDLFIINTSPVEVAFGATAVEVVLRGHLLCVRCAGALIMGDAAATCNTPLWLAERAPVESPQI
jgi:hypothetical protein